MARWLHSLGYHVSHPDRPAQPTSWQQRYAPDLIAHKLGKTYWLDCKASSYGQGRYVSVNSAALGAGLLHQKDGRRFWYIFDNGRCGTPTHLMVNPHKWAQASPNAGSGQPRLQVIARYLPWTKDMFR